MKMIIYLTGVLRRTQECFTYAAAVSIRVRRNRALPGENSTILGTFVQTFPFTKVVSMGLTRTHEDCTGEWFLDHCTELTFLPYWWSRPRVKKNTFYLFIFSKKNVTVCFDVVSHNLFSPQHGWDILKRVTRQYLRLKYQIWWQRIWFSRCTWWHDRVETPFLQAAHILTYQRQRLNPLSSCLHLFTV